MVKILNHLPQRLIEICYYLLFFLVPLILTPYNYELFEYNKMMTTYGLTMIIVGFWLIKMIINRRLFIRRTPLDLPLLLFLSSQIVSTFLSIDPHVSVWGYYSRFNGGLLSTISYILLYFAFAANFPREKIFKLLKIMLFSGTLVAFYGILEHLGIDKNIWVQDVQNRVFSTLGQPNWLAAYLAVLIPIAFGMGLTIVSNKIFNSYGKIQNSKFKIQNYNSKLKNIGLFGYWVISIIFYATLIFTKSRSGFLGLWISLIVFWLISIFTVILNKSLSQKFTQMQAIASICVESIRLIGIYIFSFVLITFLFGSPFPGINRFSLLELTTNHQPPINNQPPKPTGGSVIEVGITESGTIRRIVWNGAIDIFRHYPLFGSGVETFAFSYYKFRPVAHNMTSEWDFLYNKAHNEYLNYAATTGAFGLGSYLLIILVFMGWSLKNVKNQISNIKNTYQKSKIEIHNSQLTTHNLQLALFSAWLSILITNFFGFSVVIIQLFFFLIPAIVFVLINDSTGHSGERSDSRIIPSQKDSGQARMTKTDISLVQYILTSGMLFVICYLLFALGRLWYADMIFADGYHRARSQELTDAYKSLKKALAINDSEPFYYDEFSFPAAELAVALQDEKQATLSAALTQEALLASNFAVSQAPQNVNFWKTRTRVFYALAQMDEKYFSYALHALEQAKILSPTDPKVKYNLALLYDRIGKKDESIKELEETTRLKPDYRDAFFALSYIYEKNNNRQKAKESLQYILTKIATDDAEARKKLEELK